MDRNIDSDKLTTETITNIQFADIFNVKEIQHLQDLFSDANGVASLITHPDGTPITNPSNFCRLCSSIIRKTEKGHVNCLKSDAIIGGKNTGEPVIQPCLSGGLWDTGTSITVGGKHIANWMIGQVRNEELDEERMIAYADEIGANREDFMMALREVPVMSASHFNKVTEMLFAFANEISEKAYNNLQLKVQIEERKEVFALLQESEERFKSLYNKAPLGYQSLDNEGRFIEVNQQWLNMLGYTLEEVIGKWFGDFLSPSHQDSFRKRFSIFKAQGKIHSEFEMLHKNGHKLFIAFEGKIGYDLKGEFKQTHCILQDITERKRADEILSKSEEKYRLFIDLAPDAFFQGDAVGNFIEVNKAAVELTRYSREELMKMNMNDLFSADISAAKPLRYDLLEQGETIKTEREIICKDKSTVFVEMNSKKMPDGNYQSFFRDITLHKNEEKLRLKFEESLLESEEKFKAIANYAASWEAWFNPEGKLLWMNSYSIILTGYSPEEYLASDNFLKMTVAAEDIAWVTVKFNEAIQYNGSGKLEARCLRKDGSKFWVSISWRTILDSNASLYGMRTSVQDISDRKMAEESLKEKQRQLTDLIEFLPDATLAIDKEKRIIIWNKAIEKMTGIPAAEMIGKGDYTCTIPFYGEAMPQLMDIIFETKEDVKARYPNIIKEGDTLTAEFFCNALYNHKGAWIFAKVSPLYDEQGNIIGVIESLRDVTERKRVEDELIKQKYFYEQMFMQSSISTQILDHKGWCDRINPKLSELFGVEPKDIEDKLYNIFKDEAIKQADIIPILEKVFKEGKTAEWEIFFDIGLAADSQDIVVKNKKKIWFSNWAYPIFDENGKISNVIIQHSNITERKQTENELKEKMEDFQRLHNLTVGRELTMIGLKKEVNELLRKSGKGEKYKIIE